MESTENAVPTVADLITIWAQEMTAVADLCQGLTDDQWAAQTPCPGWSVADVAAHLIDIENLIGGMPRPDHQPDWSALPHAAGPVGQLTEVGVDARRGSPRETVIDELREAIAHRRAQLDALPADATVMGPMGKPMPLEQLLRMRTFDAWVHEQDIRTAIGDDGGWNSDAAGIAFVQIIDALPYIWARKAKAPVGSTLAVTVIGAGFEHDVFATVTEDGKGVRIDPRPAVDVQLSLTWAALVQLACGRVAAGDPSLVGRVELGGDPALGTALLQGMSITP